MNKVSENIDNSGNNNITKEEYRFVRKVVRLFKMSVENILNWEWWLDKNQSQVKKYIWETKLREDWKEEVISYKTKFYTKIERYALIYKKTFDEVAEWKTKEEEKELMRKFLSLVHTFWDNLNPKLLKELLQEESYKIEDLTLESKNLYNRFSGDERLQDILKKANFFALENKEGFFINKGKIEKYIENSFEKEFKWIANIFNMFFYSSSENRLNKTSLKNFADDLSRFFIEIEELNKNKVAFRSLNPQNLIEDFLSKNIENIDLWQVETEMFLKLIKERESYENILNRSWDKFIEELKQKRKLDFRKKEKKEIDKELKIWNISHKTFEWASPSERSRWFIKQILKLDKNYYITKEHNIPNIENESFEDFIEFITKYYSKHNFDKKDIEFAIKKAIDTIENIEDKTDIEKLYTDIGYELSIVRAWTKFFIINKSKKYNFDAYKKIFNSGSWAREMILEWFEFDSWNITISPWAKHNSIWVENFEELLKDNRKNTERWHLDIEDEQYKTSEWINFFSIWWLYLPPKRPSSDIDYKFDDIIKFQKNSLEKINALLQWKNNIDEDYKNIMREHKLIYKNGNINKPKLWVLRNTIKYAIYVSKKLEKFHKNSKEDQKLLIEMNENLWLWLSITEIKSPYRSIQKAMTWYKWDFYKNADIVRARKIDNTFSGSVKSMQHMLNEIRNSGYNNEIIQVIVWDNTWNPNELGAKPSLYKDMKVHLRTKNGNLIEIQFVCKEINDYKEEWIDIETKFLPIFEESDIKLTIKDYKIFEKTAKERNIKIPKWLQKMIKSDFDFKEDLYSDETKVQSDFFYHIRRNHTDEDFDKKFGKIESLYNIKVWNKISGELNQSFLEEEKEKN